MKRVILLVVLTLACITVSCSPVVTLEAQSLPITKTVAWDANAASDNVTHYVVRLDGVIIGSPTATSMLFTVTTVGAHTLSVTAVNLWDSSAPTTLAFNVVVPSRSVNLVIR